MSIPGYDAWRLQGPLEPDTCPECDGEGFIPCPECDGHGCAKCGGTGGEECRCQEEPDGDYLRDLKAEMEDER